MQPKLKDWTIFITAPELLPLMLGSGFLTEAIGEPPATVVGPARPAGLGDPEVVRPGESCEQKSKRDGEEKKPCIAALLRFCMWRKVRRLTAAPLVGVTGCFANKDCRQQMESKRLVVDAVTKSKGHMWRDTQHLSRGINKDFPAIKTIKRKI